MGSPGVSCSPRNASGMGALGGGLCKALMFGCTLHLQRRTWNFGVRIEGIFLVSKLYF